MLKSYTDFFRVIYNAVAEFEVVFHAAVSSAENSSVLCRAVALSFSFLHSFCLCNCLSGPAYCYYSLFCSFSFSLVCYNFYHIYCIILYSVLYMVVIFSNVFLKIVWSENIGNHYCRKGLSFIFLNVVLSVLFGLITFVLSFVHCLFSAFNKCSSYIDQYVYMCVYVYLCAAAAAA